MKGVSRRQAIVLLAYNNWDQLDIILDCLRDDEIDIYLHIDADAKADEFILRTADRRPEVILLNRLSCHWGTVSIIKVELMAFEAILRSGKNYGHIHLLSGMDMPVKSCSDIKKFFSANAGMEFVSLYPKGSYTLTHIRCHYPFTRCFQRKGMPFLLYRAGRLCNTLYHILEKMIFVHKWNMCKIDFRKGSQWVSITPAFASYLVENGEKYLRKYRSSFAPDEFFVGTALYESEFRQAHVNDNMRYIKWDNMKDEHPVNLSMADYDAIMSSDAMFARKFNYSTDRDVILRIRDAITS